MKLVITGLAVVLTSAAFAQLFDMTGPLEERTINVTGMPDDRNTPTVVYSNIPGPYSAFAARTGALGFDDYDSTWDAPFTLKGFRFVGGVTAPGGTLNFSFFDSASVFVGGFNSTFAAAGNSIYSFTGLESLNIVLPDAGVVQITATGQTLGQWFLSAPAPTVGANSPTFGGASGGALRHNFELTAVPEPGTMAALGLGAAAMLRRRRAKK